MSNPLTPPTTLFDLIQPIPATRTAIVERIRLIKAIDQNGTTSFMRCDLPDLPHAQVRFK